MLIPVKKIKLHSSDIKDMYITKDILITCSRDKRITISTKDTYKEKHFNYGYLNTLDYFDNCVYIGTQSGNLIVYNVINGEESVFKLHNENISALRVNEEIVITGSWDNTLKVFLRKSLSFNNKSVSQNECIFTDNVSKSVLCLSFYSSGFVAGLETGAIYFYKKQNEKYFFSHSLLLHNNPIRDLLVNDSLIHSIALSLIKSDDRSILEYKDYDSFFFSICDKMIVGDNGLIVYSEEMYQMNVGCIWKVRKVENNYFLCCSDGCVYIFKEEGDNVEFKINEFEIKENFTLSPFVNQMSANEKLSDDYKIENGIIYQKVDNEFVSLGRIKYDSSFSIEIENRIINVEFNKNESPIDVASRVIKEQRIDSSYKEEIADFIVKNFQQKGKFKYFTSLPVEKVIGLLKEYQSESIVKLLKSQEVSLDLVEKELKELFLQCKFLCLDLIRYFYAKNIKFDVNFLFKFKPETKKECIAYVRLITNLFGKVNFNLNVFRNEIKTIEDNRMVDQSVLDDYEFNRGVSKK